ncbi:MFS transporter [Thalassorhabdus alkalitolerans]|uniref:MFS transporter n=1 Tax=Thalassorhabdus alkalitolerans TaxID=2282697 RepID=A0ABW0YLS2_9BACI
MKTSVKKKLLGNVSVSKDLTLLLTIGGLYALAIALSNTFVNVYLWKQSGEFRDIALYQFACALIQPFAFYLAGWWTKRVDRIVVLRFGIAILSLFYFAVLYIGEQASSYLLLLGGLLGVGFGFYWMAFNVLTFEITEPDTRDFFNGFFGLLSSFAGMVGPFSAGALITLLPELTGYHVIFAVSLLLFLAAVFLSLRLSRRIAKGAIRVKQVWKRRKEDTSWNGILWAHYFQGLREGIFVFVIVLWVYTASGSEMALGTYGLITSSISFFCYYFVSRLIKKEYRKKGIFIGGLFLYAAIFLIIPEPSFTRLIIYGIIISAAYPLLLVPYVSLTYDVIGRAWNAAKMRVEYLLVREFFVNGGRITSIAVFLIAVSLWEAQQVIPWLLAVFGAGHFAMYFVIKGVPLTNSSPSDTSPQNPVLKPDNEGENPV